MLDEATAHRVREDASAHRALLGAAALVMVALLVGIAAFAAFALLPATASACEDNLQKIGYLGIEDLSCDCTTNFSMRSKDGKAQLSRIWTFRSEPVIGSVKPSGPSAGKFKDGDVITAIDGVLITTREGSRRFSSLEPGQNVRFTVRREGRDVPVAVNVGAICPEELSGVFSLGELMAPRAPEAPLSPETPGPTPRVFVVPPVPPVAPVPPAPGVAPEAARGYRWLGRAFRAPGTDQPVFRSEALPQGWLGIGLNCQECGGELENGAKTPVWSFGSLPVVSFVDPEGPSAAAGLRRGDQLTHIDGVSLVSQEGGQRFGAVKPGQVVKWRLIRDGTPRVIAVKAVQRPGDSSPQATAMRDQIRAMREANRNMRSREMQDMMKQLGDLERLAPQAQQQLDRAQKRLRYAGSVGGSDVEVRGLGNVVVDESGDEVVIITRDAMIRIKPGGKIVKTPRPTK